VLELELELELESEWVSAQESVSVLGLALVSATLVARPARLPSVASHSSYRCR
jgi:hypothetical protein